MKPERQLKIALDESRLLILGTQVFVRVSVRRLRLLSWKMGHLCNIDQSDARCWVYFLADLVSRRPECRPMQSVLDDPKLWHDCAADACVTAKQMIDPDSKRLMLGIADGYRQLSRRSEQRHPKDLPKNSGSDPADRLHAEAHGAKILFHPSFAKRGGQPHDQDGAKTS